MAVAAPHTIAARLAQRASGAFAGREDELARFDSVLAPPLPAVSLLWFHGPGGIGKSTLLTRLRERAVATGRRTAFVDTAWLAPAVSAIEAALGDDDPRAASEPGVLFIDTAEALTPLQGWLRREFLPALPATWLVVLAGRHPPPADWLADASWQGLMQVHALAPLSDDASRALLAQRGVPEAAQADMVAWARGLPLALALLAEGADRSPTAEAGSGVRAGASMVNATGTGTGTGTGAGAAACAVADAGTDTGPGAQTDAGAHAATVSDQGAARGAGPRAAESTADRAAMEAADDADAASPPRAPTAQSTLVQTLVHRFTQEVATPDVVGALRIAALSRHTTQALLADLLGPAQAPALFDALRQLSFMQAGPHGLVPHELVREVLVADAQWRDPGGTQRLVRALYRHHYGRMVEARGADRIHHQSEALYTQRHAEHKSRYFAWDELGQHRVAPARDADLPLLRAMVRRHEGDAALPWLDHWWRRQRDGFRLFWRGAGDERCDGFLLMLRLGPDTPESDRADPAVAAAWRFIGSQRALARGDELVVLRHWMHAERHQAVTAAINLTSMHVVSHLIAEPRVAWSVVWMADPTFWQPHFDGANFARCPPADFRVGAQGFGAFVHDWRFEPPADWVAGEYRPMPFTQPGANPATHDATEASGAETGGWTDGPTDEEGGAFFGSVRQALRDATDVQALGRGALAARLGLDGRALQTLLRDTVAGLATHPRDAKFRDALWHTYIEPMHKQEQVAAELGIPFPTYRYRLQQGTERVAARLRPSDG